MNKIQSQLPLLSALITLAIAVFLPDSSLHKATGHAYLVWFIAGLVLLYEILIVAGSKSVKEKLLYKAAFYAVFLQVLNIFNILTAKFAVLPVLYFPSPDRILEVLVTDWMFLGQCLLYTLRIQLSGWLVGVFTGVATGIAIGFSKRIRYWFNPLVRVLGPIPPTAWIPIVLVVFPSVIVASSFLIALAVWFPTTVLTSNGIANIKNSYFEVASTLGAKRIYSIFKVGVPAAMPFMFIGIFNGTCSSFITLVTAEMLGAKYGIGWYINWQKEMMSYANVYAGLIVMSLVCFVVITILFKLRDHLLVWQKGVIKW
ncbi:MAG: ABC transporter permease subunit [Ruminobacter sp.]|nr:ABC transporter permease subunit [Ruminobacter sp.]